MKKSSNIKKVLPGINHQKLNVNDKKGGETGPSFAGSTIYED